jgi:hypothetical protein
VDAVLRESAQPEVHRAQNLDDVPLRMPNIQNDTRWPAVEAHIDLDRLPRAAIARLGLNARIVFGPEQAGTLRIMATSTNTGTGAFT